MALNEGRAFRDKKRVFQDRIMRYRNGFRAQGRKILPQKGNCFSETFAAIAFFVPAPRQNSCAKLLL